MVECDDMSLVDSIMRHICSGIPDCFLTNLDYLVNNIGLCYEGESFDFSENLSEEDYENEDFLKCKKLNGVYFYCEYYGDPICMSYQEFYEVLCYYVEIRIKNEDEETKSTARHYLKQFKEKYNLTDNNSPSLEK